MASGRFEVRWGEAAQQRLKEIIEEIEEDAPLKAQSFAQRLIRAAATLKFSPSRCPRLFEHPNYRFLLVNRYRIVFRIAEAPKTAKRIVWVVTILYPYEQFTQRRFSN